jgi:hypothetical protein
VRKTTIEEVLFLLIVFLFAAGGDVPLPFVDPPPFPATKLCVLVIEETDNREALTEGQREVMIANGPASVRGYVTSKQGEYLLIDKDNPPTKDSPPWVAEAWKAAQPNQLPWVVAATPSAGFTRQLPPDAAETLAALKKIGGP